ncbi:MAG: GDP-mannose 4,6-dehydratase [Acidobacteriaceae bacterium]|nr:GDP-mannose 4,6-dehydratase [Acidobacteriaceae bacterium]
MKRAGRLRSALIFGGAGFIGSNWAHHLITNTDAQVHIFDNLSRPRVQYNLRWLENSASGTGRLKVTVADIRDAAAVWKAVSTATDIYHFAAQVAVTTSVDDPRNDFEVNAGGTLNILEAARQSGNKPFLLFTSTNKVYGNLGASKFDDALRIFAHCAGIGETQALDFHSPYGCSKGTADQYVHDYSRIYGLPTVVFRMSCIAGPRQFGNEDQGWVAHFLYSALQGRTISIYGDGRQVRDVLAVQDLLRAFAAVYENRDKTAGQVYNVGGGRENTISLLELLACMEKMLRKDVEYVFFPSRPGDQPIYITDFSKLQRDVGWSPRFSVQQTVRNIREWWEGNQEYFSPVVFPIRPEKVPLGILGELAS